MATLTPDQAQEMSTQLMEYMLEHKMRNCLCCESSLSKRGHSLTKGMVHGLMKFANACIKLGVKEGIPRHVISKAGEKLELDEYANWTKLRFFGLVAKYKEDGVHKKGWWLVTRNGWAFLRGDHFVPTQIKTFRNKIVSKSEQTISMSEIYGSQPWFPSRDDFFHETIDGDDLNVVKEYRYKRKRKKISKCGSCQSGVLKRRMTAEIVNGLAVPTYWLTCSNCGWKQQVGSS